MRECGWPVWPRRLLAPRARLRPGNRRAHLDAKGHFEGAQKVIAGPRQYIDPPFCVKSVTVPSGTQWELSQR